MFRGSLGCHSETKSDFVCGSVCVCLCVGVGVCLCVGVCVWE